MQAGADKAKPIGLIVDGEMRGDANDLAALATVLGLGYLDPEEASILTLSLTESTVEGAAFVDAVARFYSMEWLRGFPKEFRRYRGLPVGLAEATGAASPSLTEPLEAKDAEGSPFYPHEVHDLTDTADPAALIRNGLTTREDQSVVVVLTGPATNLARVLGLNGGRELIEQKVTLLVAALSDVASNEVDEHVAADVDAARKLFTEWPTPIVTVGRAAGEAVRLDRQTLTANVDWAENHPIVDAFRASESAPSEVSTREAAAALYAVRPTAGYYAKSEPGEISIDSEGMAIFAANSNGRHRYLNFDATSADALGQIYRELISGQPAARELPEFLKRFIEREKQKALEEEQASTP